MSRILTALNFAGVLVLAVLCAFQWRNDSRLNLQVADQSRLLAEKNAALGERDQTIKEDAADLDQLRQRLSMSEALVKEDRTKLAADAAERDALVAERDQLKAAVEKWAAAISARDAALKQAGDEIQKLAAARNEAVGKFNDLADKYNAVVKELNGK